MTMSQNDATKDLTKEFAKDSSRKASDQTLLAWIGASVSLISFGFAISKSYDYLETEYLEYTGKTIDALHTPFLFGASFMVLGMMGIVAGLTQYGRNLNHIRRDEFTYVELLPLPKMLGILVLVIGLFGFVVILF